MMSTDSSRTNGLPSAIAPERADDPTCSHLALMHELEASLLGSRKFLLALDLAGIERETGKQVRLIRELGVLLRRRTLTTGSGRAEDDAKPGLSVGMPEIEEEFLQRVNRIVGLARLQAALLARARCKLRVLANMLAGRSVTYGPPRAWNGGLARGTF